MGNSETCNVIKVRDDHGLIKINPISDDYYFQICDEPYPSWAPEGTTSIEQLRSRIEPWLTSLFQSEHLSLLIGTGLTTAVQAIATGKADSGMEVPDLKTTYKDKIEEAVNESVAVSNRGSSNIEDYFRVMNDLLKGLEILGEPEDYSKLKSELLQVINDFARKISKIENGIATAALDQKRLAFSNLVLFLMSFASRTGTRDRINVFTTNYDRVIEAGAELAGLHLIDRFVGNMAPIFRSSRLDIDMHYNPPGIRGEPRFLEGVVRYTKLHGSIDWVETGNEIRRVGLPFGALDIEPYLNAPGLENIDASKVMIFPNSSKDRETSEYPYVELFRDFAAALCRPNSTIVTYGYGFGDDHINRIISDMLTIPSTHLVIISYDDAAGRIINFYDKIGRPAQITVLMGQNVADLQVLIENFLPKSSIDKATSRMAELLQQRYCNTTENGKASSEKGEL